MACSPVNKAVKMETNVAIPRSGRETFPRQTADPSRSESFPTEFAVHQMVERQAELRPEAVAVVCEGRAVTYRELNERANQIANYLRKLGVGPETLVGLYMERTERTVAAILGILKAGGCYVPIDLVYPKERVEFILKDSSALAVITEAQHAGKLGNFEGEVICLDSGYSVVAGEPADNPDVKVTAENAAYVIFTSGSTGNPKGVIVTHHNVLRLFESTDHWFGFDHEDVWTLFHSFAFDFSVWELWGALFYGGRVVVVPYLVARNPNLFYELLVREGVTVLSQTPSAFRQLIWAEQSAIGVSGLRLRYVIFGGEALELQSLRPWYERHAPEAPLLVNMYGITETTVHVTYRPILLKDLEANLGSVIGEPIPDLRIHLLDEEQRPVPTGTPGEIYVGGEGVARGYLNRPELNAQRFVADPFSGDSNTRLYRSGDLARYLPNGDLEYLGRIDHQVKIHGFRIELGEIETVLNSHPAIRESVVICDEAHGEKRLVAYLVPRGDLPGVNEIREFAGRRLPAYMVPARFVSLASLPLTINGKVDRKALPAVDHLRPVLGTEFVAPREENERILAAIWQEVLGLERVGVNDNFFELGGDSIRSIQVLGRAQRAGVNFSLQKLFQKPTVSALVENLDEKTDDEIETNAKPFSLISLADKEKLPSDIEDAYPIARLQYGMIYHSDLDKESAIFHDVFSFRLTLPYDQEKLLQAVQRLTERHSIFRTSFHVHGFSEPLQLVHRAVYVPFAEEDMRHCGAEEQRAALIDWVEREKRHRFDWTEAPLMRLHVQRYTDRTFQFIVSFHHAIMDGWSLAMMLTELFQDYAALVEDKKSSIQKPQVNYRDFVSLEQRTIGSPFSQDYWRRKVENAVVHKLPRWPHNPEKKAHEQVRGPEIYYPASLLRAVQALARSCGVPIRTVLLAAHCRVMRLLTGHNDIMTGLVANGRPQRADGERLIGLFLNTLPFRIDVEGSWRDLIGKTFHAEQELIPHRRMPLADIQQLASGKNLFETTFDFVQFHIYKDLPGYKEQSFLEDHYFEANNFNFFVTFMLDASASELQMHFDYNPNEFSREQIAAICEYYGETLRAMAAAPDSSCDRTVLLPVIERKKVVQEWNRTEHEVAPRLVPEMISAQAAKHPDKIAVVFEEREFTYQQLNERANAIAEALKANGLRPDGLAGIYLERSLEMLASILGVLKAGGAYVPLDPNYPEERLAFMVRDSGLKTIITSNNLLARCRALGNVDICSVDNIPESAKEFTQAKVEPENLAYVIYTSGSTGLPKGVQIEHKALCNFLVSMQERPGISGDDRLLAVTTLSFDIAGLELWAPLIAGATVVIAGSESGKDPDGLAALIQKHDITMMQATPVTWSALLHSGWRGKNDLKALCGGEAMSSQLATDLLQSCGGVWNMYGPTETTIWSTIHRVEKEHGSIPIGRPIANTEIYILDSALNPVPIGSEGEIYIGGEGLARGYLNRAELTADKFIPHPFKARARLYRTGDLGRYLPDGRIVCLGRNDNQVKIRGHRIELGEIESVLEQYPAVRKAVVQARDDGDSAKELVAYWSRAESGRGTERDLKEFLQGRLPTYMIPSAWMELDTFPLTPNGKIDRKKLPAIVSNGCARNEASVLPGTQFEQEVADTWKSILKLREVGLTDDFFEVGGHSLAAMRVVGTLRSKYNIEITLANFFEQPTVQALAAHIERLVKSHYAKEQEKQNGPEQKLVAV